MALYPKIISQHTTGLLTEKKDYLPIIGNTIPNKLIKLFDELTEVTCVAGAGNTDDVLNKKKAYKSTNCRKATIGTTAGLTYTYTPPSAIDMVNLSSKVNNYATIKQTGKYKTGGTSYKDTLFIVLNIGHFYNAVATATASFKLVCYAGTKTATLTTGLSLTTTTDYTRSTYQVAPDSSYFTYGSGFLAADWEAITKIDIVVTKGNQTLNLFLHSLHIALPKYSAAITDSYYPPITATSGNAVYVSQFFGNDATGAGLKKNPFKTIEKAMDFIAGEAAAYVYIVLDDSATYKPMALDYKDVGIKNTLNRNIKIVAGYLEAPVISAKAGCLNKNRVGARTNYRTEFYAGAVATVAFVSKTGNDGTGTKGNSSLPYLTIAAAYAAAGAGECVEILDDGVYNEAAVLTIDKNITIQAAEGKKPIWMCSAGNTVMEQTTGTAYINGIIIKGNSANTDSTIKMTTAALATTDLYFTDCTFTGIGSTGSKGIGIKFDNTTATASTGQIFLENCLFTGNGEYIEAVSMTSTSFGNLFIKNCIGYMGNTVNNKFLKTAKANTGADFRAYIFYSEIYSDLPINNANYVFHHTDGSSTTKETSLNYIFNKTNSFIIADTAGMGDFYYMNNETFGSNTNFAGLGYVATYTLAITGATMKKLTGNIFYDLTRTAPIIYDFYGGVGVHSAISNNIFINCKSVCIQTLSTIPTTYDWNANVFIGCDTAWKIGQNATIEKSIFVNNTVGIEAQIYTATINNCIIYNSPNGGGTINKSSCSILNPYFVDTDNLNLGWYFNSEIETDFSNYGAFLSAFIYPSGAYTLELNFLELEGACGKTISTAASTLKPTYCSIYNWTVGINNILGLINVQNCLLEDNGTANRVANSIGTDNNYLKYNIYIDNDTAIQLKSSCVIDHITAIKGGYGITGTFFSFYNVLISDYILNFVSITNSIIVDNFVYDYYYALPTDYCIIGSRYYDSLSRDDINYRITIGEHDFISNSFLTEDYYFPATILDGEIDNSNAYNNGSIAGENIGARNINKIFTQLNYTEETFNDNPYVLPLSIIPINTQSSTDLDGNYDATVDAYVQGFQFDWKDNALIDETMMELLIAIFKTSWYVAFSFDNGASWKYFSVIAENNFEIKQMLYLNDTLPLGDTSLEFREKPDSFLITDYIIDTMED